MLTMNFWTARQRIWRFLRWMLFVGMVPVGPPLLRQEDHLLLRFYAAIMRVVQPVMHRVLQLCTRNHPNMKTLLFDLPGYSNTKYKKDFTQPERQRLDNNDSSDTYDITLIFKLLQRVCGLAPMNHRKWSSEGTLENCLQKLKNERNDLAHEALSFTQECFELQMTGIEEHCRTALVMAGCRCHQLIIDDVRVMEEGLEEVMAGGVDLWEPYRKALQNLQQGQISTLAREGKEEIRKTAQKLRILNPFVWLSENRYAHLDVGQIFTELHITRKNPIHTSDLFTAYLADGSHPRILILHGSPGTGKTSLCRFLLHDWLSTSPTVKGLENRELCLLLELRHITSNSVEQLLREEVFPWTCQQLKPDDVIPTLREVSTIWLLDGYDEASPSTKKLVKEILIKFPLSTIVITLRSEFAHDLQLLMNELHLTDTNMVCHIKGFSPNNCYSYVQCLFNVSITDEDKRQTESKKFLEYLKEHEHSMGDIFSVPLFVVLLVMLWLESPALVTSATTFTKLYLILIDNIINKISKRILQRDHVLSDRQLKRKLKDFLNLLGGIFWENAISYIYNLQEHQLQELEDFCATQNLPLNELISQFFLVTVKVTVSGTTEEYRPLHRTVQEFLAAQAFCNAMIAQNSDVLTVAAQWKKEKRVNKFPMYQDLCEKENFIMKKLHEAKDNVFDIYSYEELSEHCPCVVTVHDSVEEEDSEEIERLHCQSYFLRLTFGSLLMSFISGCLKFKGELTHSRTEQIIYIVLCSQDNINQYPEFVRIIKEVDNDQVFIKELQEQLSLFQWQPRPHELSVISSLLCHLMPESLLLHLCKSISGQNIIDHNDFLTNIHDVSKFPVNVCLDIGIMTTSLEEDADFSQNCLSILLGSESECILTGLICPLNRTSLQMIFQASHLQELKVSVFSLEDLHLLAEVTNSLHSLHSVVIVVRLCSSGLSTYFFPSIANSIRRDCITPFLPHASKYPMCAMSTLSNYREHFQRAMPILIQYPHHISRLNVDFIKFIITTWNIPTIHSHHCCVLADRLVLCPNKCCHRPNAIPPPTLQARQDHKQSIQYHKASLRRLKTYHKKIWKLVSEIFESKRLLLKRTYDRNLKLYCCVPEESVWKHMQYPQGWSIYLLKVSEYVMYEHKISIQQHRKCLTKVRVSPALPVRLVFLDAFKTSPEDIAASAHQMSPNQLEVSIISTLPESIDAYDIVKYVFKIVEIAPSVCCIAIELVAQESPNDYDRYNELVSTVNRIIEMTPPTFMFDISWGTYIPYSVPSS